MLNNFNYKNYFYPIISVIFAAVILIIFYFFVKFLFVQTNTIFQVDEETISKEVIKYKLEEFNKIKEKFQ